MVVPSMNSRTKIVILFEPREQALVGVDFNTW
jgi:hypothetical protein